MITIWAQNPFKALAPDSMLLHATPENQTILAAILSLKIINNDNKTVATWDFKNFSELTVSYSLHYTLASFFMSHTFSRMMSIRFPKELVIRI